MSECRCQELEELRPRLEKVRRAYSKICERDLAVKECESGIEYACKLELTIHGADNRDEIKNAMDNIHKDMLGRYEYAKSRIGSVKSRMEEKKSSLSSEDHSYHEEQRRREAAAAEERRRAAAANA